MKNYQTLNTTSDSRTYKLTQKRILTNTEGKCWFCGPHTGCNYRNKRNRSWKNYRKTQYKGVIK